MQRQVQVMDSRLVRRFLVVAVVAIGLVVPTACGGGDDQGSDAVAEVGSGRSGDAAGDNADSADDDASGSDTNAGDSDTNDYAQTDGKGAEAGDTSTSGSSVGGFEESGAAGADGDAAADSGSAAEGPAGQMSDAAAALLDDISCTPVADGTKTVSVGPDWTKDMAYEVVVFEGPSNPTENKFAVAVLDPGFSAATLEWTHQGAVIDGKTDDTDQLPTVAYYVSAEGQIDGLANADEVRKQAVAINDDLADEVSEEAAAAGQAMIEGLPDDALIALYASREVFFHSLDGFELTDGTPLKFSTSQPDAGGFGIEVPATTITEIESMKNDAGCVVVKQTTEPNRDELEQILDQGTPAGDDYTAETLPTFSNSLTAWVDGTTGEVRYMSRQETQSANGSDRLMTSFDLVALDAE